jgi:hypothetical protein
MDELLAATTANPPTHKFTKAFIRQTGAMDKQYVYHLDTGVWTPFNTVDIDPAMIKILIEMEPAFNVFTTALYNYLTSVNVNGYFRWSLDTTYQGITIKSEFNKPLSFNSTTPVQLNLNMTYPVGGIPGVFTDNIYTSQVFMSANYYKTNFTAKIPVAIGTRTNYYNNPSVPKRLIFDGNFAEDVIYTTKLASTIGDTQNFHVYIATE